MNGVFDFSIQTSSYGWNALFGLSESVPVPLVLVLSFVFFFSALLFPLYFALGFAEKKLSADLQARVGPNRTAGKGAFQALADTLKLGAKGAEDPGTVPGRAWYLAYGAALYATFAFLPLGTSLVFLDTEMSAFLPFVFVGLLALITLFSNEGAVDVEDEISSHREAFLWLSAWIPSLVAVTAVVARAGSGSWSAILSSQSKGLFDWNALSSPFCFIGFFVFLFSGMVAMQQPPFHSLDRGVRHRSGGRLGVFGLNRFYAFFSWCILSAALFLGGSPVREISDTHFLLSFLQLVSTLIKASVIFLSLRVVAKALPQLRQDQMTEFCWRVLTPVSIVCLVGELLWIHFFVGVGG
jgi:NADH-quinone oxidoreductase subunit H